MKTSSLIVIKSADDVIRIHDKVVQQFGGRPGVLNRGLLESAINHPQHILLYGSKEDCKIYNIAAAYFFHIIKNHAFIDGNKRTGLLTAIEFIYNNGYELKKQDCEFDDLYSLAINTASSNISFKEISQFFKKNIKLIK